MSKNMWEIQFSNKPMTAEDIQDWLACQIAEQLGIEADEIDIKVPFDSYGLDSVQTMNIANLGKQYLGLQLSPLVIWNYPNVELLSYYLAEELQSLELEVFEI
ncbi:MAG: acyl carrier protein [Nostocaceae cyanobacterium]|nr:acyl carrier protein [Nostocaceae cyanobacterium]